MKPQDLYLKFVQWDDSDDCYVGYCPDLFPFGGVCHAATEEDAYRQLCALVVDEVDALQRAGRALPRPGTRPMRDAVPA
ncbi:MAG: hypothetical protein AMXMBFR57_02960 [Acidimicrobiia bacterium]